MDENATGEKEPILWEGAAAWSQFIWLYLIVSIMMLRVALLVRMEWLAGRRDHVVGNRRRIAPVGAVCRDKPTSRAAERLDGTRHSIDRVSGDPRDLHQAGAAG